MKFLKITTCYNSYLKDFYSKRTGLAEKTYLEQKAALDYDAFGWADYWKNALTPLGYEVMEVTWNVEPMQRAWAMENSLRDPVKIDLNEIVVEQVRRFKPDILWFDDSNASLLKRIKSEVPSIRLVLGWTGSAMPQTKVWQHMDLILSCAPESVESLKKAGFPAVHIHHGFDPRINDRLKDREKRIDFSFIGQLIRVSEFHLNREQLLEQLASQIGIEIYSPSADLGWKDEMKALLMMGAYDSVQAMRFVGFHKSLINSLPFVSRVAQWQSRPLLPVNPRLRPIIKPAVFGLEMFQVLKDSKVTLNIHADSSPHFASNMRLFEITGVGTCMVMDWKDNLSDLFVPDIEVVMYRTVEECVEKVSWLLRHPKEREEIARAGQARTLKDHTYYQRALFLAEIIQKGLSR